MKWHQPPKIKVYEALGAVADKRVMAKGNTGEVYSSSGNKKYDVTYSPNEHAIMANDNGSFWQGYLGYPAIAFLMKRGVIAYNKKLAAALKGIAWKDVNVKFKNDFDKTESYVLDILKEKGWNQEDVHHEADTVLHHVSLLNLSLLGPKQKPPSGY